MIKGITKELLIDLYIIQKKSLSEIGKIFNCHAVTILNRMHKFGIERRDYSKSLKGRTIHWKHKIGRSGKKLSAETKRKISEARKAKNIQPTTRGLTKAENPDIVTWGCPNEKHWNWKGGISRTSSRIRASSEYKLWRKLCFQRDSYTCQQCFNKSCKNNKVYLNVHHIIPFQQLINEKKDLFNIDNGITLCKKCHKKQHSKK